MSEGTVSKVWLTEGAHERGIRVVEAPEFSPKGSLLIDDGFWVYGPDDFARTPEEAVRQAEAKRDAAVVEAKEKVLKLRLEIERLEALEFDPATAPVLGGR